MKKNKVSLNILFLFNLFFEARAEILKKFSLVFWLKRRHQKDISKLTDLYCKRWNRLWSALFWFYLAWYKTHLVMIGLMVQWKNPKLKICIVQDFIVVEAKLGAIHILRKHLNLITKFFIKLGFFVKTKKFIFQH